MTLAALLVLAGCAVPGGGGSQGPSAGGLSGSPTASPTGTTQPATTQPTTQPTALSPTTVPATTDPALDAYSGPRPMPASDGRPMLWPTTDVDYVAALYEDDWKYGFLDSSGELVLPPVYSEYQFCPDASGRAAFLIANRPGRRAVVFDLTGKLLVRTPTRWARCGGAGHVIVEDPTDGEIGIRREGLVEASTGTVVVPMARGRELLVLDGHTVNVSDPSGEFFLDLATGARAPHAGFLAQEATLEGDAPALPATKKRVAPYGATEPRYGYLDTAGRWVMEPTLLAASGFTLGHAIVQDPSGYSFLDPALRRVGGTWDEIQTVDREAGGGQVVGYRVTRGDSTGLLGTDLRTLVEPGAGTLGCTWYDEGVCTLVEPDGHATLVTLPDGARTPLPEGYTKAFGRSFAGALVDNPEDDPEGNTSVVGVYALTAGRVAATGSWSGCQAVDSAWLVCQPRADAAPPLVLDTEGRQTRFREVTAVYDPAPEGGATWYWVIAGKYRGFVDATGAWRYRESRYNQLED